MIIVLLWVEGRRGLQVYFFIGMIIFYDNIDRVVNSKKRYEGTLVLNPIISVIFTFQDSIHNI